MQCYLISCHLFRSIIFDTIFDALDISDPVAIHRQNP